MPKGPDKICFDHLHTTAAKWITRHYDKDDLNTLSVNDMLVGASDYQDFREDMLDLVQELLDSDEIERILKDEWGIE